ncbi:MAG TPA: hypothetical protein VF209_00645 [Patescibacteria group bacterium]
MNDTQPTVDNSPALPENENSISTAQSHVLHSFDTTPSAKPMKSSTLKLTLILSAIAIVAGIGTGYGAFRLQGNASSLALPGSNAPIQQVAEGAVKAGDVFGVPDKETFKDSAQGYLEIGGIDGEGSHKLLRPGGDSQTVYLTSSVTDLDKFDGMEVKVWGETFKAQTAGWLMDVGRVEIVNPTGEKPVEE